MLEYLITIFNCMGTGTIFTWYNSKLNRFSNKSELIKFVLGSYSYVVFITAFTLLFPNRSGEASIIINLATYVGFMWLIARRNIFFSLFEIIFYIVVTAFANVFVFLGYIIPFKVTIEQFNESILGNVIYVIMNLIVYMAVVKLLGFRAVNFRNRIWNKHKRFVRIICIYILLLTAWAVFVMDILEEIILHNSEMDSRVVYAISLAILVTLMLAVFFFNETVKQKQKYIDLMEIASTDELTGVFNRRYGLEYLQNAISYAKESGEKTTICYMDINNLKGINDRFGHDAGDRLICHVVSVISHKIDDIHKIARLGGDEFLIIFHKMETEEVKEIMDEMTLGMNTNKPNILKEVQVSFSYGLVECSKEGKRKSVEELIKCADHEMYLFKSKWKVSNDTN